MDKKADDANAQSAFRKSVGRVRRVTHDRAEIERARPSPVPRQSLAEEARVLDEMADGDFDPAELETGEEILYRAPGFQDRQFRKLRRGQFAVEAELDLHGMYADDARGAVAEFLTRARDSGRHCVRIIHGKGRRSPSGKPVLKTRLQRWLRQRKDVLAFCSARPMDGGTGAVYVLMKRRT